MQSKKRTDVVPAGQGSTNAVVALRVLAPNAIRPIEDLLPVLYPGVKVSYGTIQAMLVEAEARARRLNAQAPLGGIEAGALDEIFSQGEPVLAGVDLDSGYLFGLSLSPTRDGDAWAGVLREGQGLELSVVVSAGATDSSQRRSALRHSRAPQRRRNLVQHPASADPHHGKGSSNATTSTIERWAVRTAHLPPGGQDDRGALRPDGDVDRREGPQALSAAVAAYQVLRCRYGKDVQLPDQSLCRFGVHRSELYRFFKLFPTPITIYRIWKTPTNSFYSNNCWETSEIKLKEKFEIYTHFEPGR